MLQAIYQCYCAKSLRFIRNQTYRLFFNFGKFGLRYNIVSDVVVLRFTILILWPYIIKLQSKTPTCCKYRTDLSLGRLLNDQIKRVRYGLERTVSNHLNAFFYIGKFRRHSMILLLFSESCELCSSQRLQRSLFYAAANNLSGPLRKQRFTSSGPKSHVCQL